MSRQKKKVTIERINTYLFKIGILFLFIRASYTEVKRSVERMVFRQMPFYQRFAGRQE